jgi:hypothetical protein
MRRFFSVTLLLSFFPALSPAGHAQTPIDSLAYAGDSNSVLPKPTCPTQWSAYKQVLVLLPAPDKGTTTVPFRHIEVIDARPDTARIGIHMERKQWSNGIRNKQLVLTGPVAQEIAGYLNLQFAKATAGFNALIVIRSCWISDVLFSLNQLEGDPDAQKKEWKLRIKAEIYAEKEGIYIPLLRFDSLVISRKKSRYADPRPYITAGNALGDLLQDMIVSVSAIDITQKWEHGRRLHKEDIITYNRSRLNLLINKDSPLVQGVYRNYEEFKNNAPSIKDYEVKTVNKASILYIKNGDGSSYFTHEMWGLCDGRMVYLMLDGELYQTWKEQNAWYVSGAVKENNPQSSTDTMKSLAHVFCIDMDTGIFY